MNSLNADFIHAVGLMSGTSADAIDAVLLHTNGVEPPKLLVSHCQPYPAEIRQQVLSLYEPSTGELDRMGWLDQTLGRLFAHAATEVIRKAGLTNDQIQVIGSHGQTIRHRPMQHMAQHLATDKPGFTLQIGNPFVIAAITGITTVANFRPADMAREGEGAPLVPRFHQALFSKPAPGNGSRERVAVVNLGGIANVTALPVSANLPIIAGDTGPANTLLDLFAEKISNGVDTYDRGGKQASQGWVDQVALQWLLTHPYFSRPMPKSTGREQFGLEYLQQFLQHFPNLSVPDTFATLTELTACTVAHACRQALPPYPQRLILCGGGVKNKEIVRRLQKQLPDSHVCDSASMGVDAATLEAQAFAWFAVRTLRHLPSSLPGATGATEAAVLGSIYPGSVAVGLT